MGGPVKVVAAAKEALDKKEYAWAAQLVNHVCRIDPKNADARAIKVQALRAMAQVSPSSIARAFLLSEARALEGKVTVPVLLPPGPQVIAADPAGFVDMFRVRIDPRKGEAVDKVVTFQFGDKVVGLHVRNGIAEFLADPSKYPRKADIALAMDAAAWAQLYVKPSELKSLVQSGRAKVATGSLEDAVNEGVRRGYLNPDNVLRASVLADPIFERKNTRDNTPAVIHMSLVPGNTVDVTVAAKGGGSENKSKFVMMNPSDSLVDWVLKTVPTMGAGWCPPGMLGIGIGGTAEKAMLMAKEVLMDPIDMFDLKKRGPQNKTEELRIELCDKINALGIGAQGLGGLTTVLDVKIEIGRAHV